MDADTLATLLWPQGSGPDCPQAYAIVDGARNDALATKVLLSGLPHACLYAGDLSLALRQAAPYLVQLTPASAFFQELAHQGWGQAWCSFAIAPPDVTLPALRKHLRTLLRVRDETGRMLLFRFHDPRVLRTYVPSCTNAEITRFFGPVQTLIAEDIGESEDGTDRARVFTAAKGQLRSSEWQAPAGKPPTQHDDAVWASPPGRLRKAMALPSIRLDRGIQLTPMEPEDAALLAQATQDRTDEDRIWDDARALSEREAVRWMRGADDAAFWPNGAPCAWHLLIRQGDAPDVLGVISMAWHSPEARSVELAYWLRASARGRGLATLAVCGAAQWLTRGKHADWIGLRVSERNQRSVMLALRCGFKQERTCAGVSLYVRGGTFAKEEKVQIA